MKNSDMPAMPQPIAVAPRGDIVMTAEHFNEFGLTKREMFAMHAMQAMLTSRYSSDFNNGGPDENADLCRKAVHFADALLAQLEESGDE